MFFFIFVFELFFRGEGQWGFSCYHARNQYQVCSLGQLESLFISGVLILLLSPAPVLFLFVIFYLLILYGWVRGGMLKPELRCASLFLN